MSEERLLPSDYYLSFPHLRLSKRRYLILENNSLHHVKIKSDKSKVKFIEHISEIMKLEVRMVQSRYGAHLYTFFLPRVGRKKSYMVSAEKMFYSEEDWHRIIEFFRATGFKPHIFPDKEKASKNRYPISMDETVWFSPTDRIFQLYEDPIFFEELSDIKIPAWPGFFAILGIAFIIPGIIGIIVGFEDFWYFGASFLGVSVLLLAIGLPKIIRYVKRAKEFGQKYDIEHYFK